jgi:NAD+ synthase
MLDFAHHVLPRLESGVYRLYSRQDLSRLCHAPLMAASDQLRLDADVEIDRIINWMRDELQSSIKRRGFVVAMSGGVDSSVCAALAVRAVGARHVFGLFMPERDSSPDSLELASTWAKTLGIDATIEDITPLLDAAGCYRRRDDAIRRVVPDFTDGWGCKIVLPSDRLDSDRLNVSSLVVRAPDGATRTVRLPADVYRQIVAATNFKQRSRKMLEYYHADRLHYAVIGTPNRLEFDQGFFVKGGDGLADLKPIAHLYKTQVYQLADALGVPVDVTSRAPTTDTYSMPQSQEEFYFALPTAMMDRVLFAKNAGDPVDRAAAALSLTGEQVERAYRDIEQKRATTRPLHLSARLVDDVLDLD